MREHEQRGDGVLCVEKTAGMEECHHGFVLLSARSGGLFDVGLYVST